jgi:hypothetical protein
LRSGCREILKIPTYNTNSLDGFEKKMPIYAHSDLWLNMSTPGVILRKDSDGLILNENVSDKDLAAVFC